MSNTQKTRSEASCTLMLGVATLIVTLIVGSFTLIPWIDERLREGYQTQIPTLNPSATPTALETALERAYAFSDINNPTNSDWQPFIHTFGDGVPMVLVPAGCFSMGRDNESTDEYPQHEQCFDTPFWIDQTEVTQRQFTRLQGMNQNNSCFTGADRPETCLTWFEARDFCERRETRLPSEREWEYAARGVESWIYPWGNAPANTNLAVFRRNALQGTANVLSLPQGNSWVGAGDMAGNVWEWTSTIYDRTDFPYPYLAGDGRENLNDASRARILRGGSWKSEPDQLRAANRERYNPRNTFDDLGFRCARTIEP